MRLKTPSFWYGKMSVLSLLLLPFSLLYYLGYLLHQRSALFPYKPSIPVICIGNITAGGSGKTPTSIALMKYLQDKGLTTKPCFLSRGYGGTTTEPTFVDRHKNTAHEVGDEPLLLARIASTIVSADRKAGAMMAESHNKDMIVMDDGLQNPGLVKSLNFLVIDGDSGFGNGFLLPAGPLREPIKKGLERADAFILIGGDKRGTPRLLPTTKPLFRANLVVPDTWIADKNASYVAFSGLARPEKFKNTLEENGFTIASWHNFPDHHNFNREELRKLDIEAQKTNARLITTEKDAARIPSDFSWESSLDVMPIELVFNKPDDFSAFLSNRFTKQTNNDHEKTALSG